MATRLQYDTTAKVFHWLIVALLLAQYLIGWLMPDHLFVYRNRIMQRMLQDEPAHNKLGITASVMTRSGGKLLSLTL